MTPCNQSNFTLGQLCKRIGLARSSVINYEAQGLLTARSRSEAGYRLYGEAELERLRDIRRFRDAGLSLPDIRALLDARSANGSPQSVVGGASSKAHTDPKALLEKRLVELSQAVERIHGQQRLLARLLAMPDLSNGPQRVWSKAAWVALLRRAGFDEMAMQRWHAEFERESPRAHARFLKSLGIPPAGIDAIRRQSKATLHAETG